MTYILLYQSNMAWAPQAELPCAPSLLWSPRARSPCAAALWRASAAGRAAPAAARRAPQPSRATCGLGGGPGAGAQPLAHGSKSRKQLTTRRREPISARSVARGFAAASLSSMKGPLEMLRPVAVGAMGYGHVEDPQNSCYK